MGSIASKGSQAVSPAPPVFVFLGGACGPTTWRRDLAVPALKAAGVSYYNPQVSEWHEGMIAEESRHKASARMLLFVIGTETRALMSIAEAAYHIGKRGGEGIVLVLQSYPSSDADTPERVAEIADCNRARAYLGELAVEHNVPTHSAVEPALARLIAQSLQIS